MPIAIVVLPDAIPVVLVEKTNTDLLDRLRTLKVAPRLETVDDAKLWLRSLPLPSGWFSSLSEAKAFSDQCNPDDVTPMTAKEISEIRAGLSLTREAFAAAIGYGGNSNTRHKLIFELENGKKAVPEIKAQRARALFAAKITEG